MPPLNTIVLIKSFGCSDIGYWDGEAWYFEDGTRLDNMFLHGLEWEIIRSTKLQIKNK